MALLLFESCLYMCFRLTLREVCVYSLLFTESGRTLLEIISTGADVVEQVLAEQGK